MATKKPAAKKTTAKVSKPTKKVATSRSKRVVSALYKEKYPENHRITGKFKFFYVLFACTTIFFAALSVWLFCIACDTQERYESIDACVRAHTSCNVRLDEDKYSVEGDGTE